MHRQSSPRSSSHSRHGAVSSGPYGQPAAGDVTQGTSVPIDAVELGRADQAVDRGRALVSGIRTGEHLVFPSQRHGPQRLLSGVVVNLEPGVGRVAQ